MALALLVLFVFYVKVKDPLCDVRAVPCSFDCWKQKGNVASEFDVFFLR